MAGGWTNLSSIFIFGGLKLLEGNFQSISPKSIYVLSPNDIWAVGQYYSSADDDKAKLCENQIGPAATLHYTGTNWVGDVLPVCADLTSLSMTSSDDGWAISEIGNTLLHYESSKWDKINVIEGVSATRSLILHKIAMSSARSGWVVGSVITNRRTSALLLHYDGTDWRTEDEPFGCSIYDISALPSDEMWAACVDTSTNHLLHYKGGNWSQVEDNPSKRISHISAVSSSEVWAVTYDGGSNAIWLYKDNTWSQHGLPPDSKSSLITTIQMLPSGLGWVVAFGSSENGTATGQVLLRYNGKDWLTVAPPDARLWYVGQIFVVSADDVWTVGVRQIWHYKDGKWTREYGQR